MATTQASTLIGTEPAQPAVNAPTARPTTTTAPPTEQAVNQCLNCHSDKERLMVLAKPEEVDEGESKGVG